MDFSSEKLARLASELRKLKTVLVAYSGGVDSSFILWAACRFLGINQVLAVTANSASYPPEELSGARQFAESLGLNGRHLVIDTEEISNKNYADNSPDRCFFCKEELYTRLTRIASQYQIPFIVDGFNASDVSDFRPGKKAADLFGVRSPLRDVELTKTEIREIARNYNLSFWSKPAMACLSSRIPYGEQVTVEKLQRIGAAERFLKKLGFTQVRVRHHQQIARIEIEPDDFARFNQSEIRSKVTGELKRLGFSYVTLDLAGYRTGSLNETLRLEPVSHQFSSLDSRGQEKQKNQQSRV